MTSPVRTSPPASAARRLRLSLSVTDVLFLVLMAMLVIGQFGRLSAGNLLALAFVLQQVTVIVFTLLHRPPQSTSIPWRDIALAWAGTLLPLALRPNGLTPNAFGGLLVLVGIILSAGAVLSLGRSFGIEAANRGIQTRGFYRFVRHPIYATYLPLNVGYLLAFPSWFNASVLVVWMACQVARIRREEAVLCLDPQYQLYAQGVRWRLIPGVW